MKTIASAVSSLGWSALVASLMVLYAPGIGAQERPASRLPSDIASLHSATMARLSAPTRRWIAEQGDKLATTGFDPTAFESSTLTAIRSHFAVANATDAAAIVQLVLAEGYRAADADARASLQRLERHRDVAAQIGLYLTALRDEIRRSATRAAEERCDGEGCARLAKQLPALMTTMRNAGVATIAMSPTIATVGDPQLVGEQLDAAAKQLESQASRDEELAIAARARRDRIREALPGYLAKVSQITGSY